MSKISYKTTQMYLEASQTANCVRKQIESNYNSFVNIGEYLRQHPPQFAISVARGSSDHAGVYARYLIETQLGIITSHAGLSVSSIYKTPLHSKNCLCIAISQSGQSPDIITTMQNLQKSGAFSLALVNDISSPLASLANKTIPLWAGEEKSVAATKSFITSMTAIVQLIAHWQNNKELIKEIDHLPELIEQAWNLDWSQAVSTFTNATSTFVLGRGIGYGLAREAALKFKETCSLHAESFSAAEVLHGPAALIKNGFPILAFAQDDKTKASMTTTLKTIVNNGGKVFTAGLTGNSFTQLPTISSNPLFEPILMAVSFYKMVNQIAISRGYNPDQPANLSKVTETI